MIEGCDYSVARPGGATLAAAGKRFAARYLAYSHASAAAAKKFLTAPEVDELHGHGLAIVAIFESTTQRSSTAGDAGGFADGTDARVAMKGLGFPAGASVYAAAQDSGLLASQFGAVATYLGGFRRALGSDYVLAGYGGTTLWRYLQAHGFATIPWWQAAALSWSGYTWDPTVAIQQRGTTNVPGTDADQALVADYGQWEAPAMGVRVKQAATVSPTAPWAAFGTARTAVKCASNDTGTGAQTWFPAGADLGVVQLGELTQALGKWPVGTPIVLTNVNGEQAAFIKAEVVFTPIAPPVPPPAPTQTLTVTGQNISVRQV